MKMSESTLSAAIESITAEKVFTFVGYAVDPKGRAAVRYTNDKRRTGTLLRGKFTDVKFVALPRPILRAHWVPGQVCLSAVKFACTPPAASPFSPARTAMVKGTKPPLPKWWLPDWASP